MTTDSTAEGRDRDGAGRARSARRRDDLGRPTGPRLADGGATTDEPALPPDQALDRAQQLLDSGQPFAAHEVLEAVWKATSGPDRDLWRGLAQLAVGLTHALRGNETGARSLLDRAAVTLAPYAATTPHGVAVDHLRDWAMRAAADAAGRSRPPALRSG